MNEKSAHVSSEFIKVFAEGEVICIVDDITTAVACYLASFYAFHLRYIAGLDKTITFYQFAMLKIDDQTVHKSVLTLLARLSKKRSTVRAQKK